MTNRRIDIDCLKAIAIIGVVAYHMGLSDSGYLGVDLFLVINGYLVIPSIIKKIQDGSFSYFRFIKGKYDRLAPLVLIASVVCLLLGSVAMMPDAYQELSKSVIASSVFSSNILSILTSDNYWDVLNNYNPMLHMWYVGILAQFYIIFPLVILIFHKISKKIKVDFETSVIYLIVLISSFSIIFFLLPSTSIASKFYNPFFRFYEFIFGGLCAYIPEKFRIKNSKVVAISTLLLIFVIFSSVFVQFSPTVTSNLERGHTDYTSSKLLFSSEIAVLLTVLLSCLTLLKRPEISDKILGNRYLSFIGVGSYSIFIWHQVILGFYRSYIENHFTVLHIIVIILLISIISFISYRFIEKHTNKIKRITLYSLITSVILIAVSMFIYSKAGVIRDVPELELTTQNAHRGIYGKYNDRIYQLDRDFNDNGNIKCLVCGNSFARDFANIILESKYADSVDISYSFNITEKLRCRLEKADFVFIYSDKASVPSFVFDIVDSTRIYGIGTKNLGESNSIVFSRRNRVGYDQSTNEVIPRFIEKNKDLSKEWGGQYVDIQQYIMMNDSECIVFDEKGRFLSRDCRHLTKAGAEWFSKKINFEDIFERL